MAKLSAQSLRDLYGAASTAAMPGGGAVTALSGMLGVSLILKALRISLSKREDAADHAGAAPALEATADLLEADADADSAAFAVYLAAARLPRTSDGEKAARAAAMQRAAAGAAQSALDTLEHARLALGLAKAAEPLVAANIVADLDAGIKLLEVTALIARENAETNLPFIKDPDVVAALKARLDQAISGLERDATSVGEP